MSRALINNINRHIIEINGFDIKMLISALNKTKTTGLTPVIMAAAMYKLHI